MASETGNIIVYVSSRNNYDMLEHEVLKNIDFENFEFINVDDHSEQSEVEKGQRICNENGIVFLQNKGRGVQMATQTLIDFVNLNRKKCKWIVCFQHDIYPISKNFFTTLSKRIQTGKLDDFGCCGFNVLDPGDYTDNAYDLFLKGGNPIGMLGLAHLSVKNNNDRWICPVKNPSAIRDPNKWKTPFVIEIPMWAAAGINVQLWNETIIATENYQFHLWFPDIAMQFNYANKPCLILPDLYCFNNQYLKEKYSIPKDSASGARNGNHYHFGEYGNHLKNWMTRWGWNYERILDGFPEVQYHYQGTIIVDFFNHNIHNGPLKQVNIE